MKKLSLAIALFPSLIAVGLSPARADGPDVIAIRQSGYDLVNAAMAAMKTGIASGQDVKNLADTAEAVEDWSKLIPSLFPPGSDHGGETKAKPEIWTDRAGFEKAALNFTTEAGKLTALAKAGDSAGFAAQFQTTGKSCSACHRSYRMKLAS